MIPPFNEHGELPEGVHEATWAEFVERYGLTPQRTWLIGQFGPALRALQTAGADMVFVGGSFVTAKPDPGDIDAYWTPGECTDLAGLPSEFLSESGGLAGQADLAGLDLGPDIVGGALATGWLSCVEGHPDRRKGTVLLRLSRGHIGAMRVRPEGVS